MNHPTTPTLPVEVLEQVQPSGTLIDVRESREYAAGHIPGALLMPMRAYGVDAHSVTGGTTAWQRSGRPVEVGS